MQNHSNHYRIIIRLGPHSITFNICILYCFLLNVCIYISSYIRERGNSLTTTRPHLS